MDQILTSLEFNFVEGNLSIFIYNVILSLCMNSNRYHLSPTDGKNQPYRLIIILFGVLRLKKQQLAIHQWYIQFIIIIVPT